MLNITNQIHELKNKGLFQLSHGITKLLLALVAVLLLGVAGKDALAAPLTEVAHFGSNPGNLRMFKYIPENGQASSPLVVALHGCQQSAAAYDDETGWTRFADQWGFALLLPQQREANNRSACFNWFQLADITRGQGEALSIKQMIDKMKADFAIDDGRIFAMGHSAGAAQVVVMLATWPDVFAAGDVCAFPHAMAAGLMRLECWKNADAQGALAAC
jgi:poly(3-hydroxybutyrate) depolymerase